MKIPPESLRLLFCLLFLSLTGAKALAVDCPSGDPKKLEAKHDKALEEWITCRSRCSDASECVVIRDACPGWTAVNSRYRSEREAYLADLRPRVDCAFPDKKAGEPPRAECRQGQCTVESSRK